MINEAWARGLGQLPRGGGQEGGGSGEGRILGDS